MINKDTLVKVINKDNGTVGYSVPDLGVIRNFQPNETKEISYEELEKLSYLPGSNIILGELLEIQDEEVARKILNKDIEPEYHYTREDVKTLLEKGTLDQFLDCLDFAPEVVKEMIKTQAVDTELNDMSKRKAILDKLGFDVTKAIEIKNTKYDGGDQVEETKVKTTGRRTAPLKSNAATPAASTTTRRATTPTTK